jgi:hypothetical protein
MHARREILQLHLLYLTAKEEIGICIKHFKKNVEQIGVKENLIKRLSL